MCDENVCLSWNSLFPCTVSVGRTVLERVGGMELVREGTISGTDDVRSTKNTQYTFAFELDFEGG